MNRCRTVCAILTATLLIMLMAGPAMSNEQGRRNTALLLAGLTGAAAYLEQPYVAAGLGLGTLYAAKRYNDDVRNNRAEEAYRAGYREGYGAGGGYCSAPANYSSGYGGQPDAYYQNVPYNGSNGYCQATPYSNGGNSPQVVPTSYRNSYSQNIRYKGYSYRTSQSNSATFRSPPRQSRAAAPQVIVVVVRGNGGSYPQAPPSSYNGCAYGCGGNSQGYIPSQAYYQSAPVDSGYYGGQVLPSSYHNRSSRRISYKGGSYGYTQRSSATFRRAPVQAQPTVIYY